jgi:peroxiredoxin
MLQGNGWRSGALLLVVLTMVGCQEKLPAPASKTKSQGSVAMAAASTNTSTSAPQRSESADASQENPSSEKKEEAQPQKRIAFYRADSGPAKMPRVLMSKADEAQCRVKVGDTMPAITLPKVGENDSAKLADLYGEKATVVVFWKGDRRMAREQLADIGSHVIEPFGKNGVRVVGIAVNETAQNAQSVLKKSGEDFTNLLDADGKAFAQVGSGKLPRTYLLDPSGKILWFDIEYSLATRRELHQALRTVAGDPASTEPSSANPTSLKAAAK